MTHDEKLLYASQLLLEMLTLESGLAWEILVRLCAEDTEIFRTIRRKGVRHEQRVANLIKNRLLDAESKLSAPSGKITEFFGELDSTTLGYLAVEMKDRLLFFKEGT